LGKREGKNDEVSTYMWKKEARGKEKGSKEDRKE